MSPDAELRVKGAPVLSVGSTPRLLPGRRRWRVEDVVAVEVRTDSGSRGFLMTWGRIQDALNPGRLEELGLRSASRFALEGRPVSARVCNSLREASSEPYFFEALLEFTHRRVPFGDGYEEWRQARSEAMEQGKEIYFPR
jgi:hypothetical protein